MSPSSADAITEPSPPPQRNQHAPEDPVGGGSWFKVRRRGLLAATAMAPILGALFLVVVSRNSRPRGSAAQASGSHDDASQVLRLNGATEAVQTRAILAPLLAGEQVGTLTITKLALGGSRVKRGDLLVEFDRQAQVRNFIDKQADYDKLVDRVTEEQAKENAAKAKDETEIRQAGDNLSKAELEMQKVEIVSRIDAEKAQEDLDEAKATLQQLRETFDLKRKAAQAAIRILEIQRDRTRETMRHAQANSELMQIHAPIDGVVVLNTIWKQGKMGEVQDGDQVRRGVPFMQVVDPSRMDVRAAANQEDFLSLQIGQTVQVHRMPIRNWCFRASWKRWRPLAGMATFLPSFAPSPWCFQFRGAMPIH